MKHLVLILLALLLGIGAMAQSESSILKKADKMIAKRQYESAFQLLESFDPANDRVEVLLKKEDILLNYFVQSINHRIFSLRNLEKGETLNSARTNFQQGVLYPFDADSLLRRLLSREPGNCRLLAGYAQYYNALLNDYNYEMWIEYIDSACLATLTKATSGPCANGDACYLVGLYYNLNDDPASAMNYYRQATLLSDTCWNAIFNLGVLEYDMEQYPQAVEHLRRAYHGYPASSANVFKADAARALGIIYTDHLNNPDSAMYYLQKAVETDSSNFNNHAFLLRHHLLQGSGQAPALLRKCWNMALEGESSFSDAHYTIGLCVDNGHANTATTFLKQTLASSTQNYERALCNLFLGQLAEDTAEAVDYLQKSIKLFQIESAPDTFISSIRELIEERQTTNN